MRRKFVNHLVGKFLILAIVAALWPWAAAARAAIVPEPAPAIESGVEVISPTERFVTHADDPQVVLLAPSGSTITVTDGRESVGSGTGAGPVPVNIVLHGLNYGLHQLQAIVENGETIAEVSLPAIFVDADAEFTIADAVANAKSAELPFLLRSIESRIVAPPVAYDIRPGTEQGTTSIYVPAAAEGLFIQVSNAPIAAPIIGSALPHEAAVYRSGDNITGADIGMTTYIGLYQAKDGRVLRFAQFTAEPEQIAGLAQLSPILTYLGSGLSFQVHVSPDSPPTASVFSNDDFTVSINGDMIPSSNFSYDPAAMTLTMDRSIEDTYAGKDVQVIVNSSRASNRLAGTAEITVKAIHGKVTADSPDGAGVSTVKLLFRDISDTIVGTTYTDSTGYYSIRIPEGRYNVEMSASGYLTSTVQADFAFDRDNNLTITHPPLGEDLKIILTWGDRPPDMDAHLVGPSPGGGTFHVYYGARDLTVQGVVYASLDVDDRDGRGPETTTMSSVLLSVYGTFTYYVHNYSGDSALSGSGAVVEVFQGNAAPLHYEVPVSDTGTENYWHVFDIVVDEQGRATIVSRNRLMTSPPAESNTSLLPKGQLTQ